MMQTLLVALVMFGCGSMIVVILIWLAQEMKWIHFHKWSKWKDVSRDNIKTFEHLGTGITKPELPYKIERITIQARRCTECEKLQERKIVVKL